MALALGACPVADPTKQRKKSRVADAETAAVAIPILNNEMQVADAQMMLLMVVAVVVKTYQN